MVVTRRGAASVNVTVPVRMGSSLGLPEEGTG